MHVTSSKLKNSSGWRSRTQRGVSLILACCALTFVIPLTGLVVDVGILYVVRGKLQASVDGASLAAARALNLGQTTTAQAGSAKQNAVNWFYANFPTSNWATSGTVMDLTSVNVFDDTNNPQLRNVTVTASTLAPTYFMHWFNKNSVLVNATGNASRRDVVAMLVLDRSGSMCYPGSQPCDSGDTTSACAAMITAAKTFTGQFAAGRDRIGLLTFSDGAYIHSAPTTNFQAVLGYSNTGGSGAGSIDTINCNGGTGTAGAVSLAYNELYKMALPGALNLIVLETDGLPNTVAYNFWDGSSPAGLDATSGCTDNNGKTRAKSGWATLASMKPWTSGHSMNTGGIGYMSDIPAGAIGSFYASDPGQSGGPFHYLLYNPWQTSASNNSNSIAANGAGGHFSSGVSSDYSDIDWLPGTDIYGNSVKPTSAYKTVSLTGGRINLTASDSTDWPNTHGAALNATDNAAYRARTNSTLPATMFIIGLDSNKGATPPDAILLQRMANDAKGDTFNATQLYFDCATETDCITYPTQPLGTFIYSPNTAQLNHAFLTISSQILRLSR